jgi:lysophospholipase L1-like esterase
VTAPRFSRYVALGDSSTEGLDDPIDAHRYRGWADRLAVHVDGARRLAAPQAEPLLYANLAIRGRRTRQILDEQLAPALAMKPDLASVFGGTNDIIRGEFRLEQVIDDIRTMQRALRDAGATVLTITMLDLSAVMPFAKRAAPRLREFNAAVREVSRETGTIVVDLAAHPFVTDPRFWSEDRLHANSEGHERIAAALAHALGLPHVDDRWAEPLPPREPPSVLHTFARELHWTRKYFIPWVWRHARGRSSGDGITAKRPRLSPVTDQSAV